jgi:hypothetical protein
MPDDASGSWPDTDSARVGIHRLGVGAPRAERRAMTQLEDAFDSTMIDLYSLRHTDIDLAGLLHLTQEVDFEVGRLCEVLAEPEEDDDPAWRARQAYRVVLELARLLETADSDDRRTRDKLDLARGAVEALLDALGPLVSSADRALRDELVRA